MHKAPLIFTPYYQRAIWGGERISRYKGEQLPHSDIGASWEVSAIGGCESVVAEGPYSGRILPSLIEEFGARLLGDDVVARFGREFPLLVKYIDARENLSVQVHPADELALRRHGTRGKTEMWYIIDALPGARIFSGLTQSLSRDEYVSHVERGTFPEVVASHPSQPGDVYFIPAGQIHAIGAGNLLAEIQQPSDITYRIFDYKRKDSEGRERELHTDLALEVVDLSGGKYFRSTDHPEDEADLQLIDCEFFRVRRLTLTDAERELALPEGTFSIVMCTAGEATLAAEEGTVTLTAGHTTLLPAVCRRLRLSGPATLLLITP